MNVVKMILDWTASIAWPFVALCIALLYRKQINSLLVNVSGIVERVSKQPVEIALGEKFKLVFGEYFEAKSPKTIDEAKNVAAQFISESLPLIDFLKQIKLNDTQREILRKLVSPNGTKHSCSMTELSIRYPKDEI